MGKSFTVTDVIKSNCMTDDIKNHSLPYLTSDSLHKTLIFSTITEVTWLSHIAHFTNDFVAM